MTVAAIILAKSAVRADSVPVMMVISWALIAETPEQETNDEDCGRLSMSSGERTQSIVSLTEGLLSKIEPGSKIESIISCVFNG